MHSSVIQSIANNYAIAIFGTVKRERYEKSWKRPLSSLGYRSASALLSVHELSEMNEVNPSRKHCYQTILFGR